jgi:uncharacterized protein YecE (DUF72 family)
VREGRTFVGTSGWEHRHWRKTFYPEELPRDAWLRFYAQHFPCVEVGASFHELPEETTLAHWRSTPHGAFHFALRAPRTITHAKKLKHCEAALATFLARVGVLEERLGPLVFELPPEWRPSPRRLDDFLRQLPGAYRYVFAFADPRWRCRDVYAMLEAHGVAACRYDAAPTTHTMEPDPGFVYVRLQRAATRGAGALRGWAARARAWNHKGKDVFLLFHDGEGAWAVKNARRVQRLLSEDGVHHGRPRGPRPG